MCVCVGGGCCVRVWEGGECLGVASEELKTGVCYGYVFRSLFCRAGFQV